MNLNNPSAYLKLLQSGGLAERAKDAQAILSDCRLCGWNCGIDRSSDLGPCRTGIKAMVATAYIHWGEESPLVGRGGSGAIFFAYCDLRCQFCQTYRWNILGQGQAVDARQLANMMLALQGKGAVNINFVTPTHVLPQILEALLIAANDGLMLPLVWNSGGYDLPQALQLLDGIIDIYLPDLKYSDADLGHSLSGVKDYPAINQQAVTEMHRQVGNLKIDTDGVARRGVLARHLVMPGHLDNTLGVLKWLKDGPGTQTYLSLMDQYRPAYRASARADINKPISREEFLVARRMAESMGFTRLDEGQLMDVDVQESPRE